MARILILSLVFPPDSVSTAHILGDLAVDLQNYGHNVSVLTTSPHYNRDLEAEANQSLESYWGRLVRKSCYQGIPVYHIIMPQKGKNVFLRLASWTWFHAMNLLFGIIALPRPDVIIVPSPPLTMGINGWLLSSIKKSVYIYNVQEIYPDFAINMGAINNRWLIKVLFAVESFVYKKAAKVIVIAPHMARNLFRKRVPSEKIKVIPNFVDINMFRPLPKENNFSRAHGITDKFVVSYAGNMGPGQDLDKFIDVADLLRENSDIHFMMMGNGMLRDYLARRVREIQLPNFTLLSYQPYSLMPHIYAASDISLVPQAPNIAESAVPSKVYRIMACARPVVAYTVPGSDLANLVMEAKCGMVVNAGSADSPQQLAAVIADAVQNPEKLRRMGASGRQYVEKFYSRAAVAAMYNDLISAVANRDEHSE